MATLAPAPDNPEDRIAMLEARLARLERTESGMLRLAAAFTNAWESAGVPAPYRSPSPAPRPGLSLVASEGSRLILAARS